MTKTIKLIIGAVITLLIIIGISLLGNSSAKADSEDSKKLSELIVNIHNLQLQKQECVDNLSAEQTDKYLHLTERYCYEFDDEIMKNREEFDKIMDLPYKHLNFIKE